MKVSLQNMHIFTFYETVPHKLYKIAFKTLIKELGINSLHQINLTYVASTVCYDTILKSHSDFVKSVGLKLSE